ncbi:hypothetical protein O3M35_000047 [Rhynocoris fuscipes]|uniref:Histone-lysine N-methyltransferase SETMAR n=1 Tax=Rhynocoris fuscipes TaxID=488301 RepID=A0AAW1DM48_9HEMI
MVENIVDNYEHPNKSVTYIKESFKGAGLSDDLFNDYFENVCGCIGERCNSVEQCYCLQTHGVAYESGLLKLEYLQGKQSVFECSRYCCCNLFCDNKVVQAGPNKQLYIREVLNKGYGVFASTDFSVGTFICEYAGEVIGRDEAQIRLKNSNYCKYVMQVIEHWQDTIIETFVDAYHASNIGRYLNHSCEPNCVVIPVRIGRLLPMLCFFTSKPVTVGEELTYFYCPNSNVLSKMPCYCGSKQCLQFIPSA